MYWLFRWNISIQPATITSWPPQSTTVPACHASALQHRQYTVVPSSLVVNLYTLISTAWPPRTNFSHALREASPSPLWRLIVADKSLLNHTPPSRCFFKSNFWFRRTLDQFTPPIIHCHIHQCQIIWNYNSPHIAIDPVHCRASLVRDLNCAEWKKAHFPSLWVCI